MNRKAYTKRSLSRISTLHYSKLVFRSILFLAAVFIYVYGRNIAIEGLLHRFEKYIALFLAALWLAYAAEMVLRFFPSKFESMGCQKQFSQNFSPTARTEIPVSEKQKHKKSVLAVAIVWILFNAVIGALFLMGHIDQGIMLLISLAFSVCDMICILFFCPFQTFIMKNRCCGSCRIYNWDYAMMFTPLIFIKSAYTWSLLALSLILLIKWEVIYRRHPERFFMETNGSLACSQCREKLCNHKKSIFRVK